jgi:hypothetical protein
MRHIWTACILSFLTIGAQAQTLPSGSASDAFSPVGSSFNAPAEWGEEPLVAPMALRSALLNTNYPLVAPDLFGARSEKVRSVPLAFGMSAILPGSGQAYNRQYVKAGVAILIEAAAITTYSILRKNGHDAEHDFQDWAHRSWSPVKYASWLNDYSVYLNEERGGSVTAPPVQAPSGVDFTNPDGWSAQDQAAVNAMFEQIRTIERQVFHPETGAVFSHQIPDFDAQQYYELIGKYFQFAPGWEDYAEWKSSEGAFTAAIDPEMTGEGGSKPNVSTTFYSYARDHADAQDTLREASRISLIFIFNHLIAAVDAAVSSKLHNDRLDTSLGLTYTGTGQAAPVASLRFKF